MDRASYVNHARAWQFVEEYASAHATPLISTAAELTRSAGLSHSSVMQASLLSMLVQLTNSKSVICVGTGNLTEVAALIEGLSCHGQLTAVDSSPEGADAVKALIREIGESSDTSLRVVHARPGIFLPRLNAQDYDLIVISGDSSNYADTLEQSHRLLTEQGTIVFTDVLASDGTGENTDQGMFNPADRSTRTVAMRELLDTLASDDLLVHSLLPVGTGMCIAHTADGVVNHATH